MRTSPAGAWPKAEKENPPSNKIPKMRALTRQLLANDLIWMFTGGSPNGCSGSLLVNGALVALAWWLI
jgi:hypothetical protein